MEPVVFNAQRVDQIDSVKAVAMLLVLLGHAPGLPPAVMSFIYAFHMPVFFFLSGLLLSETKVALPYQQFLMAQFRVLGVPYLFFFALSYAYWLPTHSLAAATLKHGFVPWWGPLLGFLQGGQEAWIINAVLWFFVCLFMTTWIYFLARRIFSVRFLAVIFSLLGILFSWLHSDTWPRWPWMLDSTVIALGFYAVGNWTRAHLAKITGVTRAPAASLAATLFLVMGVGAMLNGKVDLNFLAFGELSLSYFLNAYLGIVALWCVCLLLPRLSLLTWVANNTIIIFPSHLLFYSVFTGIGVVLLGWPHDFKESSWIWIVLFPVLALVLSYPLSLILTRFFPFLIGKRNPRAPLVPKKNLSTPDTITPAWRP